MTVGNLVTGTAYNVTFISTAAAFGSTTRSETLAFNGGTGETVSPLGQNSIVATTDTVTAVGGQITAVLTPPNAGSFVNAIIVTQVPEPSTIAMMLMGGLLVLGFAINRRRLA